MIATFLRESYGRFLASRAAGPTQNQPDATPTSGMCCYLAVGNESCDLDSAVCAIAWAFYQHVRCAGARICVPVLNVPRCDVALRTDVTWALRTIVECEDWAAHVVTREDLHGCFGAPTVAVGSNDAPPKCGVVRVGLVDHNAPCARQGFLAPHVWDVVDHHADNGAVLRGQCEGRGGVYDVRAVGSCTSIVAEYLLQLSKEELEAVGCKDGRLPMELARALLAGIVVDTSNFSVNVAKATEVDVQVCSKLCALLSDDESCRNDKALVNDLYASAMVAKSDVSSLTCEELLRRDYKHFACSGISVGTSSIVILLDAFLSHESGLKIAAINNTLEAFAQKEQLDVLLLLFTCESNGDVRREIVIFEPAYRSHSTVVRANGLLSFLTDTKGIAIEVMRDIPRDDMPSSWTYATLNDVSISRKKLMPIVMEYFALEHQ